MHEVGVILAVSCIQPLPRAYGIALGDDQNPGILRIRAEFIGVILAECRGNAGGESGLSGASRFGGAAKPEYYLKVSSKGIGIPL